MKAVILAGGMGTRLAEETQVRPKPMVKIGPQPILWHIMKIYAAHGVHDFVICCGYKGYMIKEYFANYALHSSDVTFDLASGEIEVHQNTAEPWRVTVVDTGLKTATGGRLRRVREYLDDEPFCFTYGDGVSDVDVGALVAFHRRATEEHGALVTMTAVQPPSRFGVLAFDGDRIADFEEKPHGEGGWINGGFFVMEPQAIDYVPDDTTPWEHAPMRRLVDEGKAVAHLHHGFWQCMDTLRDKNTLQALWDSGAPPWRVW
ncbi:MAG: glucose-1-phosphate cytidylyltransferase [Acidobacteriota bacterium]